MRRPGFKAAKAAFFFAALCLVAGAGSTAVASSGSDLIDVVSVSGTSSAASAVSVVPMLAGSGTTIAGAPIALPTAASGSQNPLTMSGSAGSEGFLNLSGNGQYLTLAGYAATPGTSSVASTASSTTKRVAGRIDGSGNVDTSTAVAAFTQNNARSAVSNDGSEVWFGGAGTNDSPKTAVYYAALGATTATGLTPSPATGSRDVVIAGGHLYLSTTNGATPGVYEVGTSLPTSNSPTPTLTPLVTGSSLDPYSFALVQLGSTYNPDTLYVADGTAGGITKYSYSGTSWTNEGTVGAGTKLMGLAAKVENGGVQLYATTAVASGNALLSFFDSGGANAPISSGSLTTIATAAGGTSFRGVAFAPSGQSLTNAPPTISLADTGLSRAIGDSWDPTQTTATISDSVYPASQLTVTATSDNTAVVPTVAVSGSGATRTLTISSNDVVGLANITVTVTTPDGRSASAVLQYGVSAAAPDSTSNWLYDFSNASTAVSVGGGYYVVGDDEFNQLALYQSGVSGPPVTTWDFGTNMGVADSSQLDLEASARLGNTIYWFGSEGNNSTGDVKANRQIVFATTVSGSGSSTQLSFAGFYKNMRTDLINWDNANGAQFGFAAGAAQGQIPKEIDGFNIEGAEFAAGGSSTLYLGFRAPIVEGGHALVVPLTNLPSLMSSTGDVGTATFGTPLLWDLTPAGYMNANGDTSALGIREIRKNADDEYLIIAGSYEEVPPNPNCALRADGSAPDPNGDDADGCAQFLYTWDGNPADQPVETNTLLPTPDDGSWETIVATPDPLAGGSQVTMLQDDGDDDFYNTGQEAKDLTSVPSQLQKDRSDVITVALAPQTVTFGTSAPSPAYSGTSYTPSATGGASGNQVTLSVDATTTGGACSFSGATLLLVHPGTCGVDADQAGTFQYAPGHASQSFPVTLPPPPVVTVPSDKVLEATGPSGAAASFSPTATDVIDGTDPVSCNPASGSTFPLGETTVLCSATDSQGVQGTASFDVTVQDTTPPVVNVPGSEVLEATGPDGAAATFSPSATDLVDGPDPVTCLPGSGSTFPLGTTTVTCSATDAHGNTGTASFDVTVEDTTPPVLSLPTQQTAEATGPAGAAVSFDATANDVVDGSVPVQCSPASGSTFPLGPTTVTCSATDAHGNTASGTFTVTVRDTTPPALSLPSSETVEATGPSGAVVTYSASANDLVDGAEPVICAPSSGSTFPFGATVVQCSASDSSENTATGSFTVTVVDTTPPLLTLPSNVTVPATGPAGALVDYTASATDTVDGFVPAICLPSTATIFPLGTTTVNCMATDAHGNTATGSFTVTVVDSTPPAVSVPAPLTLEATGPSGATATFTATATDLVDGTDPVTCLPGSGSTFPLGTTTVDCSATDSQNLTGTNSFTVTVKDTTPPTLHLANVVTTATGPAGTKVSYTATATDLVDGTDPVTCLPLSGATFPIGVTIVSCASTDAHGNTTTGMFTVDVMDNPTLSLPGNLVVEATRQSGAVVTYTATATDPAHGADRVSCAPRSGSVFPFGVTTVDCSATDPAGYTATGSFTVTVQDTTPPVLHLPRDRTVEAHGPGGTVVTFDASASDTVDGSVAVTCTPASGSLFPVGATAVACSATDAHGNTATGSFTVNVVDTTPPRLDLPPRLVAEATGPGGAVVTFAATADDLVDGSVPVSCTPPSGSTFPLGVTVVHCSATDAHGNTATGSFTVTVRDTTPPVLTLPADITVPATGASGAIVTYTAKAVDAVDGSVPVSCLPASGTTFKVGSTTVRCSATDAHGNRATGTFTVTVTAPHK
jgi:large repetitive protein